MPRAALALLLLAAAACGGGAPSAAPGLVFRAQCAAEEPGALAVEVQGQAAWFGPARRFALEAALPATDAQGHPALTLVLAPEAARQFEAFTAVSVAGPLGIFLDGELVAAPAAQPVANGRFTFCNEAGGWSAADRDRWLARIRASGGRD